MSGSRSSRTGRPEASDWLTVRVVLTGQPGEALAHPPGRVLLAHADHAFADLAEAIDTAFGRWDLTPLHRFEIDDRVLVATDAEGATDAEDDTDEVTLGEVGLRQGARFAYVFDLDEEWLHDCRVEAVGVDPDDLLDEEPDVPTPVDGWGDLPDQYGRREEEDEEDDDLDGDDEDDDLDGDEEDDDLDGDDEDDDLDDEDMAEGTSAGRREDDDEDAEAVSWQVVAGALRDVARAGDAGALGSAASGLRDLGAHHAAGPGPDVLYAAAELSPSEAPDDDEELWLELAAAVVAPAEDVPLDDDSAAAWAGLEPADWAGAVIELVRSGPGTPATPDALVDLIARCPEVDSADLTEEDEAFILDGLEVVVALWRLLGIVDDDGVLTPLGAWGLPRALERAWTGA